MDDSQLYAVIMAGGSGTRFWPASRRARPKQFLPISGDRPMLRATFDRLEGLVPAERTLVVTAASQAELVAECLPDLPRENLIAEPTARNTSAAVALGAFEVARRNPDGVQVVLPADHHIAPVEAFRATLRAGAQEADSERGLITFGIRPDHPATGYGYIETGDRCREVDGHPVHAVSRFVEKPDRARAEEFLASGNFLWNAGIFCWRADAILDALATHQPEIHTALAGVAADDPKLAEVYPALPSISIDVGVMERAADVRTIPIDYTWNDVGSWSALADVDEAGDDGNWRRLAEGAELLTADAKGCIAYADDPELIAVVGLDDVVVVRAGKRTLVCPRDRAQDVKRIVEALQAREDSEHL
ncbi:MAG: mannose-1-phosphate guanylyltransferase [Planctomycetota bacterium]|jgi:mannose-1-phosphate guanylyltransferase